MKVPVRMYKMSGGGQYNVPEEGDVVAWLKLEGDHVVEGEGLCEFEADKGTMTIIAPISGTLVNIAYPAGKGTWIRGEVVLPASNPTFYDPPFCWIETDESVLVLVPPTSQPDHASLVREEHASIVTTPIRVEPEKIKPRMSLGAIRLMEEAHVSYEELFTFFRRRNIEIFTEYHIKRLLEKRDVNTRSVHDSTVTGDLIQKEIIKAVPLARTIAREKKIDLVRVQGTGPEGLILVRDVERKAGMQEVHATQPAEEVSEEPILLSMPRLWRTIAANMEAASRMPTADIRVDGHRFNIRKLTEFYRANRQSYKLGLWFPFMVAYARILGREQFILFNSYWHEEVDSAGKIIPYIAARKYVHMGIAYDRGHAPLIDWDNKTIQGERLRILTIQNVHRMSLTEIASEVRRLFETALQNKFSLQDTSGHTAIFNNIGVLGHHSGRALLTSQIASMLNLGLVDMESGEAVVQLVLDHRLIDGAATTLFFRALYKELMQCVLPELEALLLKK